MTETKLKITVADLIDELCADTRHSLTVEEARRIRARMLAADVAKEALPLSVLRDGLIQAGDRKGVEYLDAFILQVQAALALADGKESA
jgi:hypothetical protein